MRSYRPISGNMENPVPVHVREHDYVTQMEKVEASADQLGTNLLAAGENMTLLDMRLVIPDPRPNC